MKIQLRHGRTTAALLAAALIATLGSGCAFGEFRPDDPMNRKFSLEKMQKRYSYLIRWSKFKQASQFIDPRQREDFMEWAPDPKKIRFTDYEIGDVVVEDEEKRKSTVEVTYTAYSLFALVEYEIHETQEWERIGRGNNWVLKTSFAPMPPEDPEVDEDGDGEPDAETDEDGGEETAQSDSPHAASQTAMN